MKVLLDDDALIFPRRVHNRYCPNGARDGADHKRKVGECAAFSKFYDARKVRFKKRGDMGRGLLALDHPFGNGLPHLREGEEDIFVWCWLTLRSDSGCIRS